MAQTTAVVGAIGTAIATTTAPVVAKSPLAQAFDEMTVIAAIMGLFGGLTMAISNRETWREMFRGGILGLFLAVGFGALAPTVGAKLVEVMTGAAVEGTLIGPQGMAAYSYVIGLAQHLILERVQKKEVGNAAEGKD